MGSIEKLTEISRTAAEQASRDLVKLTGKEIDLNISAVDVRKLTALQPALNQEDLVTGIYVPLSGDIAGSALLVLPGESAATLCDVMVGREPGTTRKLTKLDESALEEVGNIVTCSYAAVMSNQLQANVTEYPPVIQTSMFGALLEQCVTNVAQSAETALVVELNLAFRDVTISAYFLLLFEAVQLEAILASLD